MCILFLAFTSLNAFNVGDVSFSLYVVSSLLFILLISVLRFKFLFLDNSLMLLILVFIMLSSLLNFEAFKLTSIVYSLLFLVFYSYQIYYSKEHISYNNFVWILKCIIITFFIVLIISQLLVLFDLQSLERPKGYFQSTGQLGIQYNHKTDRYRFHSLSTEPSYAAIIVMLSFAILSDLIKEKKKLIPYGLMLLFMLFSFKSSLGFIILAVWILTQVKITKKHFLVFMVLFFIAVILFFFTDVGGKSVDRIRDVVFLLFTDFFEFPNKLNSIDSSAYARVGPTFRYLSDLDFFDYHTYFGYGATSSEPYFSKIVYPEAWNTHMVFTPPFLTGFLYDYGFIGTSLVLIFIWSFIKNKTIFYKITFFMILINSNFNTQLFWFAILTIALHNFFKKNDYADVSP